MVRIMIEGLSCIVPKRLEDARGFFLESYQKERYSSLGVGVVFCQDNHSYSKKGVLRGMHFQRGQAKLVYCPKGQIFDVAVDLRENSPTFGKWEGVVLDEDNHKQLFIPDGFAHGFYVLSDEAHVIYKVSTYYDPLKEGGFRYDDPDIGIEWPNANPVLSERDRKALRMRDIL